jgi:hypothetical protein
MSESATVVIPESMPMFGPVQLAAAGFLARYSGPTCDAYALDLKTYFAWCAARHGGVRGLTRSGRMQFPSGPSAAHSGVGPAARRGRRRSRRDPGA